MREKLFTIIFVWIDKQPNAQNMIFDKIIKWTKTTLRQTDNKEWIAERIEEIQKHKDNLESLPFKIEKLSKKGFLTKVKGLYSYISFYHMPWKYSAITSWKAIAPSLIGKRFYCKIYEVEKNQTKIVLDGEVAQFKKVELVVGEEYTGLIIAKYSFGLLIDIGYHFDWKCGSLPGLLHKSQFPDGEKKQDFQLGQEIEIVYQKTIDTEHRIFCSDKTLIDWQMGIPQGLLGQLTWARVIQTPNNNISLLVAGKYKSALSFSKNEFPNLSKWKRSLLKNKLKPDDIINCEVLEANTEKRTLKVKCLVEIDTNISIDSTIADSLDNETRNKLKALKNSLDTPPTEKD
ncbi:MAG: hypothetical protein ACK5IQ_11065 [Bacteroidales bacterium]